MEEESQMGFMDKFKGQMEQAEEMAKQAGGSLNTGMPTQDQAAYAQLANKLATSGVPCKATIKSLSETGAAEGASKQYAIDVSVEGNGEPYEATVNQYLIEAAMPSYQPGAAFEAKADPDDRTQLLLFGLAS
jgi:hypothetical protein